MRYNKVSIFCLTQWWYIRGWKGFGYNSSTPIYFLMEILEKAIKHFLWVNKVVYSYLTKLTSPINWPRIS